MYEFFYLFGNIEYRFDIMPMSLNEADTCAPLAELQSYLCGFRIYYCLSERFHSFIIFNHKFFESVGCAFEPRRGRLYIWASR